MADVILVPPDCVFECSMLAMLGGYCRSAVVWSGLHPVIWVCVGMQEHRTFRMCCETARPCYCVTATIEFLLPHPIGQQAEPASEPVALALLLVRDGMFVSELSGLCGLCGPAAR